MRKVLIAGAAALAATGVIFAILLQGRDQPEVPPEPGMSSVATKTTQVPDDVPRAAPAASVAAPAAAPASSSWRPPRSPSQKLAADFRNAKDWRSFALDARRRPVEGGRFYAMYVLNLCGAGIAAKSNLVSEVAHDVVGKTGTVSPTTMKMMETFVGRCASFAPGEASALHAELKGESGEVDPLVKASDEAFDAYKSRDTESLKKALQNVFALDDLALLDRRSILSLVMSMKTPGDGRASGDLWFEGKLYKADDVEGSSPLAVAIALAPCTGSSPCQLEQTMMLSCLGGQVCSEDPIDYYRKTYVRPGMLTEAKFQEALALSRRIRQAIASGNVAAFVP